MANTATTKQLLDALTYDTYVYTAEGVEAAISSALTGGYKIKGTKTVAQLNALAPTLAGADSSLKLGDTYNLSDAGTLVTPATSADAAVVKGDNVVWTEDGWDRLRGLVDLSGYATTTALATHTGDTTVHITAAERTAWNGKQAKITASGILKGDGSGGVTAATAGTDYVAPVSGKGLSTNDYTTDEKTKLAGIADGANLGINAISGTTGSPVEVSDGKTTLVFEGSNVSVAVGSSNTGFPKVTLSVADGSTSAKGVVQMSDSTSSDVSTTAATSKAVKSAYDRGSAGVTAAAAEKTKRNAVASALSTYSALTASSTTESTRLLINALLSALQSFGADS